MKREKQQKLIHKILKALYSISVDHNYVTIFWISFAMATPNSKEVPRIMNNSTATPTHIYILPPFTRQDSM